ncbi:MAG: MmgE/PrpD family protein, partial [Burkholderiales bacterium]
EQQIENATSLNEALALRLANACVSIDPASISREVIEKVKVCLFDLIGCAVESRSLPWSLQAKSVAQAVANQDQSASIIAQPYAVSFADAAFANAVMGHGLVREDMHSGSVSHLGIVVLPTLLALSQYRRVSGQRFCAAAMIGYEAGAKVGRAAMSPEIARIHRPTGISGPIGAAAAGACLLGLDREAITSAIALAANTTLGFNEWAHTGGSEMYFQAGFAARNALTAVLLTEAGAFASPSAIDGEAGLLASLGKRAAASTVKMFEHTPEIMNVYHKPVPACNFAQTPSQAALAIAGKSRIVPDNIESIRIRVPSAGMLYPGCNHAGPFAHILQAKMSIQYNVAAALIKGGVTEDNFSLLNDPGLHRLISLMTLEVDDTMTQAYPSQQGGEVEVTDKAGKTQRARLDDVVNATDEEVHERFRRELAAAFGDGQAGEVDAFIQNIEQARDAGKLAKLFAIAAT